MFINSIMSTVKIPDGHPDVKDFNFTGFVTAPTVAPKTSNLQVATTAFVTNAINELIDNAPAALDTLKELATAIGNGTSFSGNAATATKIATINNSDIVQLNATQTLTNKSLTSPTITGTGAIAGAFTGNLTGNADTATKIATINNSDIVQLNATQTLTNKSLTSPTITGTGAIAGAFTGNLTGNADTATKLATPRAINGVNFDGTSAITIAAAAGTLTGATLNANVTGSSLTSVGTLANLTVSGSVIVNGGSIDTTDQNEEVKLFDNAANLYVGGKSSNIFIGTDNPVTGSVTTVKIGAANDTVNILGDLIVSGTTTKVNTTDLEVTDKLITLNKGGNAGSAPGAGFTIEANGQADAAYIKVHSDSAKFAIKAPNLASGVEQYIVTKDGNNDFSARNITVASLKLGSTDVTATAAELNILDGVTATAAELNYLDIATLGTSAASKAVTAGTDGKVTIAGDIEITSHNGSTNGLKLGSTLVTATAAELNILDGVTATKDDLNKLAGTTVTTAELNKLAGVTATTAELNKLAGVTATTAELNKLAGVTATKDDLNKLAGTTVTTADLTRLHDTTDIVQLDKIQELKNKTLIAPRIVTLADSSGNEVVVFGKIDDAINEIKISNAAANLGPTIAAQGGDDNVDLNINTKGTGKVNITSDVVIVAGKALTGNVNGNAATAATLTTARTIGGVSFNGSANIDLPGVNTTGNQNTSGSAATLTTARTIGGVSFNGSANIDLPGVNTTGNQNTSGNAATATTATDYNTGSGTIKNALDLLNFTNLITTSGTINLPTKSARYYIKADNVVLNVPASVEPGTTFTIINDSWKYRIGRENQTVAEKLESAAYSMSIFIAINATQWMVYSMPIPGTSNF